MAKERGRAKATPAPKQDNGTQLERVRGICLAIPNALEKISHGEPTFFTPKRVFAMFADNHHGDGHVAMWIPAGPGELGPRDLRVVPVQGQGGAIQA